MDDFFSRFVLSNRLSYRVSRHVLFWIVCWAFMGFIYSFLYMTTAPHVYFRLSYTESLFYLPQHMVLSYGIIYFFLPKYILRNRYWLGLAGTVMLILLAAMLSPVIQYVFVAPFRVWLSVPLKEITSFHSFMAGLRGSTTVAGFAVAIKLVKHWYFKKVENEILEKEKLKAELQLLKGHLHPHFIFNTLNSIYSLSLKKSHQASEAILKLAELMRYVFAECNDSTIQLSKEVQNLYNYIELGRARFRERLDIAVNISGDFENQRIPPLLFLPFLENSFKYGTHEMLDSAWITLDLTVRENELKFKLVNGKSPEYDSHCVSSGTGLHNVKKRLKMLYPDAHTLRITEDADTFIVQLNLQLEKIKLPLADEENKLPAHR
jgi:sensor histidine kinase YesM